MHPKASTGSRRTYAYDRDTVAVGVPHSDDPDSSEFTHILSERVAQFFQNFGGHDA